jgi:hypothetical protein
VPKLRWSRSVAPVPLRLRRSAPPGRGSELLRLYVPQGPSCPRYRGRRYIDGQFCRADLLTGLLPCSACNDVLAPSGSRLTARRLFAFFGRARRLWDRSAPLLSSQMPTAIGLRAESGSAFTQRGPAPTPYSRAASRLAPRSAPVAPRGSGRSRRAGPRRQTRPEARTQA